MTLPMLFEIALLAITVAGFTCMAVIEFRDGRRFQARRNSASDKLG